MRGGKNRRNQRTVRFVGSKVRVLRLLSQGAAERVVALENDIVQQQRQQQQQQRPRRVRNCERIKGETKEKDKKKRIFRRTVKVWDRVDGANP